MPNVSSGRPNNYLIFVLSANLNSAERKMIWARRETLSRCFGQLQKYIYFGMKLRFLIVYFIAVIMSLTHALPFIFQNDFK